MKKEGVNFDREEFKKEELEKTKTFSKFGLSNMEAMRLLRDFGLLGKKEAVGKLQGKERSYKNIAEHCLVVGMVVDVILQEFEERGLLTPEEREKGTKAAIIHDLPKRQHIEVQNGIEAGSPKESLTPDKIAALDAELLAQHNISQEDVELFSLSEFAGSGKFEFPEDGKINVSGSPEDIIRFAILFGDHVVSDTSIMDFNERIDKVIERGRYNDEFVWWYRKLYGEEKLKGIKDPKEASEKIYGKVRKFLQQTEDQFKSLIGVDESESLLDYIKEEIKKRYESNVD